MQSNSDEDFLQFKDYSNMSGGGGGGGASSPPPAQINVNSPTHAGGGIGGSASGANAGRARGDPLSDLIYDMSSSALSGAGAMSGGGATGGNSSGGGGGTGGGSGPADGDGASTKGASFLTIEYYQQFFNVDTYMVLERIANSMVPKRAGGNYLKSTIGLNPDLYGPFWITITLIFCIAISGNIASYLQSASESYKWRYNFHLVSVAASCIFVYACCLPAALWALFKYSLKPIQEGLESETADYTPSLLSLMCIYGYSLAIYIPVSILWVIQFSILQWLLVITAAFLSGSVLIAVLTPALRNSKISLFIIIGILSAHFLMAAGFMLYFFHVPSSSSAGPVAVAVEAAVTKAATVVVKQLNNTA